MGRKTKYTKAVGDEICERLAAGESLRRICRDEGMPAQPTVTGWAIDPNHPFADQYARARRVAYEAMADEVMDIADDGKNDFMESEDPDNPGYNVCGEAIQRSRLRVDTRKWFLGKVLPKIYGDKIDHNHKVGLSDELEAWLRGQA